MRFGPLQATNQDAMPLSDLEGYGSDPSSSILSHNSDAVPNDGQLNSDSNKTASDSADYIGELSSALKCNKCNKCSVTS